MRGKVYLYLLTNPHTTDHPRACGEKTASMKKCVSSLGSPPRMRGKVIFRLCRPTTVWDHPRACGEKYRAVFHPLKPLGSPPRMRGKEKKVDGQWQDSRITPAHAGKSAGWPCSKRTSRDHPRACGEKEPDAPERASCLGSPPRMRGKVDQCNDADSITRITPAHAGKSHCSLIACV